MQLITVSYGIKYSGCSKLTLTVTFVNCINHNFKMHLSTDPDQLLTPEFSKLKNNNNKTHNVFFPKEKCFVSKICNLKCIQALKIF